MPLIGRKGVDDAIDDLVMSVNNDVRGVYLAGLSNIVKETPADTGRARNNWFLTVNAPSNRTTTSKDSGGFTNVFFGKRVYTNGEELH